MKSIIKSILVLAIALLPQQSVHSQGIVYVSNLAQPFTGSVKVGNDSWRATVFHTGNNVEGYKVGSVQLAMANASGNPGGFAVMLYGDANSPGGFFPGSSLGVLSGSSDPATSGVFTFEDDSNITLLPNKDYFLVLTAGTPVATGAYNWGLAAGSSYNPIDNWYGNGGFTYSSSDGSSWSAPISIFSEYAISASAVPEPGVSALFFLGGWCFVWYRWRAKVVA